MTSLSQQRDHGDKQVILAAWATKNFPTQPTQCKKPANAAELGPLYWHLQLPQKQVPELKPGIDLQLLLQRSLSPPASSAVASSMVRSHSVPPVKQSSLRAFKSQ